MPRQPVSFKSPPGGSPRRLYDLEPGIVTRNVLDQVARLWAFEWYRESVWDAGDWFQGWYME